MYLNCCWLSFFCPDCKRISFSQFDFVYGHKMYQVSFPVLAVDFFAKKMICYCCYCDYVLTRRDFYQQFLVLSAYVI